MRAQQPTAASGALAAPPPGAPFLARGPALRSVAAMCAARMSPLAHIFRGTFVHSTWTCPMEVLKDHLLGVNDSGKVSGRGVWRSPTGGRAGGQVKESRAVPYEPRVHSVHRECRSSGVELECLPAGRLRKNSGVRSLGWPGGTVLPEAGSPRAGSHWFDSRPGCRGRGSEAIPLQVLRDH